jgi:signal transduction histidine kinase
MTTDPAIAELRRTRAQQQAVQRWLWPVGPLLICYWVWVFWSDGPAPGLGGRGLVVSVAFAGFVVGALGVRSALWPVRMPPRRPLARPWRSRSAQVRAPVSAAAADEPGGKSGLPGVLQAAGGLYWASLGLLLVSSAVLLWAQSGGAGIAGLIACALLGGRRLSGWLGLALVLAGFAGLTAVAVLEDRTAGPWALVGVVAFGAFYGMTYLANRLGEANEQAERLLTELERTRAAEARAAGLAERQRLAREMHDVLAHSLSGMMLQLEAARMLAAAEPADPRLPDVIERAHHLGNAGLAEASRAIGMLRDEELPGPERLPGLAARFAQDRGVPCELAVSGPARPLPEEARLALYRVAQEALTNIAKHAAPERVRVSLAYEPEGTRLTVEDFGAASVRGAGAAPGLPAVSAPRVPGGGYGLTGMRERAELIGADLTAAATDRGFRVELRVPA